LELLASQKTDDGEIPRPIPLQDGVREYVFKGKPFESVVMYEFLIFGPPRDPETQKQLEPEKQRQYIVLEKVNPTTVRVRELKDFQYQNKVFYLNALNAEQNCFANAVVVYRVPMVIGEGEAGTGKTFFALACAYQLIKDGVYTYTILTRDAVDSGQKLGFMPGGKQAKVGNYLPGALGAQKKLLALLEDDIAQKSKMEKRRERHDEGERRNIEKQQRENERLTKQDQVEVTTNKTRRRRREKKRNKNQSFQGNIPPTVESVEIKKLLELKALLAGKGTELEGLNFMRGASYPTVLIVDESQHTDLMDGKMLASRMEEEGQLLLIGNVEQDDIGVPIRDSGVAKLIEATRGTDLMCLVTFQDVERSRLAARIARFYNK
jgi:predicted ribonuclease YlaK